MYKRSSHTHRQTGSRGGLYRDSTCPDTHPKLTLTRVPLCRLTVNPSFVWNTSVSPSFCTTCSTVTFFNVLVLTLVFSDVSDVMTGDVSCVLRLIVPDSFDALCFSWSSSRRSCRYFHDLCSFCSQKRWLFAGDQVWTLIDFEDHCHWFLDIHVLLVLQKVDKYC